MYREIEASPRMTENEASELYPDSFVILRMDSMRISDQVGTALYIGDNYIELFSLISGFENPSLYSVVEGLDHRCSLGGVVVGG